MKICYTGGGTGGHIIPAIAVAQELRSELACRDIACDEFWIGTRKEQEQELVRDAGIRMYGIPSGKLRRYLSLRNLTDVFRIVGGIVCSYRILRKERPDVLFSKGGFASVPPVFAAHLLGIPSVTHESDASAGLATRINARFATYVCVSFKEAAGRLLERYPGKIVVTGNPVRKEFVQADPTTGQKALGLGPHEPFVLILGGSQGALQINELVWNNLDALCRKAYILHQSGEKTWKPVDHERYRCVPYIGKELPGLIAAATVVVSRAGAGSLAELAAMRKPMLLVPLGSNASRGDQILNAKRFEREGAAEVLYAEDATPEVFLERLTMLLDHADHRNELGEACRGLADIYAARRIVQTILLACNIAENTVREVEG